MKANGTDDPCEVLPNALARLQIRVVAEACQRAKEAAEQRVDRHALKEAKRVAGEAVRSELRDLLEKALK